MGKNSKLLSETHLMEHHLIFELHYLESHILCFLVIYYVNLGHCKNRDAYNIHTTKHTVNNLCLGSQV